MATIDADRLRQLFAGLGELLAEPTTLCLIGSAPAIASGQSGRQTADIDLWHARSHYDAGDLDRACRELGVLYDPRGELDPDAIYLQIVRPGLVQLPPDFDVESLGRYGRLDVVMPAPEVIVAAKLVRGSDVDIEDAVWWVGQRNLDLGQVADAVSRIPDAGSRETAAENLSLLGLAAGRKH